MSEKKIGRGKDIPATIRREIKARVTDLFNAVREIQPDKDMSNVAISGRLSVVRSAVSNWERMDKPDAPALGTLIRLSNEYDVTLDWLVFGKQKSQMHDDLVAAIRQAETSRLREQSKTAVAPEPPVRRRKTG